MEIKSLPMAIKSSLLKEVTFDKWKMPLFGDLTSSLIEAYITDVERDMHAHLAQFSPSAQEIKEAVQHQVHMGAYLAGRENKGRVYEIGCASAVPSITYALLTGKEITAIDCAQNRMWGAQFLKEHFRANTLEIKCADVLELIREGFFKREDTLIALHVPRSLHPKKREASFYKSWPDNLIFSTQGDSLLGIIDEENGMEVPIMFPAEFQKYANQVKLEEDFASSGYNHILALQGSKLLQQWALDLRR